MGGSLLPLFLYYKFKLSLCSLVLEITSKRVLSFLIPKMVYVQLFPKIFCLCSLFPSSRSSFSIVFVNLSFEVSVKVGRVVTHMSLELAWSDLITVSVT